MQYPEKYFLKWSILNLHESLKLEKLAGDFSLKAPFINLSAQVFLLGKKYLTQKYQLCIVVAKKR